MRKLAFIAVVTLAVWIVSAPTGVAQQVPCGHHADLIDLLRIHFSETPVAIGLDGEGRLVEILASPAGSWTMLLTRPGGPTCVITSGRDWQQVTPVAIAPGA